jgi:hypothetical protein
MIAPGVLAHTIACPVVTINNIRAFGKIANTAVGVYRAERIFRMRPSAMCWRNVVAPYVVLLTECVRDDTVTDGGFGDCAGDVLPVGDYVDVFSEYHFSMF